MYGPLSYGNRGAPNSESEVSLGSFSQPREIKKTLEPYWRLGVGCTRLAVWLQASAMAEDWRALCEDIKAEVWVQAPAYPLGGAVRYPGNGAGAGMY